jgi:predicted CXXCH cytochrome family protein
MRPETNQNDNPSMLNQCIRILKGQAIWITGAASAAALILISCSTGTKAIIAPPGIPGATFVGSDACEQCHDKIAKDFGDASHARLKAKGDNAKNIGCESCHGPGSKHVESGGGKHTIVNPRKSPDTCFQCHLDVKAKFMLPNSHPVMRGKVSCSDCHNPHKGSALKGGGTQIAKQNETCFKCHTAQRGPFVFEHQALREGCTVCHDPHGTVNARMLTERNGTLCAKCHMQDIGTGGATAGAGHIANSIRGACWSAGCHEAIHGSQVNKRFRY